YDVMASLDGFFPETAEGIGLISGETVVVDFFLEPVPPSYCTENLYTTGCISGDGLTHFGINDIVNSQSGCSPGGYGDFTAMSTDLSRGYAYEVTLMSGYSDQYVSLWIDFDDDFEFSESERLLTNFHLEFPDLAYQATITIPAGAPEGAHRMRVRTNWNSSSISPCDQYQYGEAEDYTIMITNEELTASLYASVFSDVSGDPVENAEISVLGSGINGTTGDEGICLIEWIEPGNYDVEISAFGYQTATVSDVYLFAGQMQFMEIYLEEAPVNTHEITVPAGWSGLSSYIVPANNALEDVFAAFLYDLVMVQNFIGIFWPQEEVNTIGNWENHSAYAIKTGNGFSLPLTGYQETDRVFSLNQGWTMLPVICIHNPITASLFAAVEDELVLVKEIAGTEIYWPSMGINTLTTLQPGKAYLVKMQSAVEVTFPENMVKSATAINLKEPVSCELWDNPVPTANSHIIAIPESVWTSGGFSDGDLIGVFTSEGICAGLAPLTGNTSIAVFGHDPLIDEKQGFITGELMNFRIFKPAFGEVLDVEFEFDPDLHFGNFNVMGVSVVTGMKTLASAVSENGKVTVVVFPNPTTGIFQVNGFGTDSHISILNSKGEEILSQDIHQEESKIDLSDTPPGIYLLSIRNAAGVIHKKVIVY
ncbi:MAG: GEVED domain-containing protein, partial [Bacteroidales bacterium]